MEAAREWPDPVAQPAPSRRWAASIELRFAASGEHPTELARARHQGPLRVQRLFHPDGDGKAHCYLLHPPGGVAPGDDLRIDVRVDSGAALVTTPSAGRFYDVRDTALDQSQQQRLRVLPGALLEWLPQETLLFNGARARLLTDIDLAPDGGLAFWDVLVLGRPASGERFTRGKVRQELRIRRGGELLLEERLVLSAGDRLQHARAGLNGCSTVGTAIFHATLSRDAREHWLSVVGPEVTHGRFAITQRGELLIARYLGEDAAHCRGAFSALWQQVQAATRGAAPSEPRIWHT